MKICPSDVVSPLSYSKAGQFLNCRRAWWFRYIERIVPLRWPEAMTEGSLIHFVMERSVVDGIGGAVAKAAEPRLGEVAPKDWQLVRAEVAVTAIYQSPEFSHAIIEQTEVEFEFPFKIGKKTTMVRGKVDAVGWYEGRRVAFEYKRVSSISSRTMENLQINNQSQFYREALARMNIDVGAVVYVFVAVPKSQPKLALAPVLVRYKNNGEPYANQQLVDETITEYRARTLQWYAEHPDAVQVYVDQRSEASMKEFKIWLKQVIQDMYQCVKTGRFYRNSDACRMRSCAYYSVCQNDCPEIREVNYINRVDESQKSTDDVAEMEF